MTSSPSDNTINFHPYPFYHWLLSLTSICNIKGSINAYIASDDPYLLSNAIISLSIATMVHMFVCYLRILNHINFRMLPWLGSRLMARPLRSRFESPGIPQKKKACWRKTSKLKTRIRENKFFEHMLSVRPLHGLAPSYKFMFLKIKFFLK